MLSSIFGEFSTVFSREVIWRTSLPMASMGTALSLVRMALALSVIEPESLPATAGTSG